MKKSILVLAAFTLIPMPIEISEYKDPQDKMTLTIFTFYIMGKQ